MKHIITRWLILGVLGAPLGALAQSDYFNKNKFILLKFSLGFVEPETGSEIFQFNEDQLTLSSSDFEGTGGEFKIYRQINNIFSIGGGVVGFEETVSSEYRDYVFEEGGGIYQDTTLENDWVGMEVVFTPFGSGDQFGSRGWAPRQFVPYFTLGAGIADWQFYQIGDFVDEDTLDVFFESYETSGNALLTTIGGGLRINLSKHFDLELSYTQGFGDDNTGGGYEGFGDIDLGWKRAAIGITFRM